jgi:parallel beta-helix repeat protein
MKKYLIFISVVLCSSLVMGNTFTVANTSDSGTGSLRAAISNANAYPGAHSIVFNIPLADAGYIASQGVWKINLTSTLPILNHSNVTIDGTTQTAFAGNTNLYGPEIMLDGGNAVWADFAFHFYNCSGCTVKGLIIGGFVVGIQISGASAQNNFITGNYIGCNYNATDTLGNTHGIYILAGPHHNYIGGGPSERNIISGNNHTGMRIVNSNYNVIQGNYVGLNRTGNAALRNYDGISIEGTSKYNLIGGYTSDERNYVSGNVAYGIPVFGAGCNYNIIAGNYVGTDISGTQAIPNTYGVLFDDGASYNLLGGRETGAGNLLSGNSAYGLFIYNFGTMKDTIIGNLIGTDYTGTQALPNANGIVIDGPSFYHTIDSNVISGNSQNGISIHIAGSDSNIVINNKIGTDITGLLPVPNQFDGIRIGEGPRKNLIGLPGQGNIIAYNGGNGISVMTAADLYNTFTENSIFANAGLGIDLFPMGVTPNDAGDTDTGPNDLMNFPVITDAFEAAVTHIIGHVDCPAATTITVEIFKCDFSAPGNGQGKIFVGRTTCDANGDFELSTGNAMTMDCICATATDHLGNTSEFSENVLVGFVGVEAYKISDETIIFPVPVKDHFVLQSTPQGTKYSIINTKGITLKSGIWDGTAVNTTELEPGAYALRIHTPKGVVTKKFVKE